MQLQAHGLGSGKGFGRLPRAQLGDITQPLMVGNLRIEPLSLGRGPGSRAETGRKFSVQQPSDAMITARHINADYVQAWLFFGQRAA